ncbi:MAG: site-2 protease family protein, partial [Hadesarchaea archaeon]|nr:site-2 protease family protein [Hadesarchaea archaeon]
ITIEGGMLMWRTKHGLWLIDRIARTSKRGWFAFGTAAAIVGAILMVFVFVNLAVNAVMTIQRPEAAVPGVRFVIPGITIPLVAGLIAIVSVLVVHEVAHGIVLRAQGLPAKSVGLLLLLVIPGAFVEPDEEKLNASPVAKRLRVFGAGSFANVIFAFLCLGIILVALTPRPGVYVLGVRENGPSQGILAPGMRLYEINGIALRSEEDYYRLMRDIQPGEDLTVLTDRGTFVITACKHPRENMGDLGVLLISAIPRSSFVNPLAVFEVAILEFFGYPVFHPYVYSTSLSWGLIDVLKWMFLLNGGVGLFNLLPAVPLDGGYIFRGLMEWLSSAKVAKKASYVLSILVLAVLLINIAPLFW